MIITLIIDSDSVITGITVGVVEEIPAGCATATLLADEFPAELQDTIFISGEKNDSDEYTSIVSSPAKPLDNDSYEPVNNNWQITAECATDKFYHQRAALLLNSDWTQVSDAQLTAGQVTEAQQWRQQLRDITGNSADPLVWLTELDTLSALTPSFIKIY